MAEYIMSATFARPFLALLVVAVLCLPALSLEAVYAVNCGGDRHRDTYGVVYQKDTLPVGTASDFGKSLIIRRAPDAALYQTERYHHRDFSYSIPIPDNGEYMLVLKFSEVYFQSSGGKLALIWASTVSRVQGRTIVGVPCNALQIFDVRLNGELNVVTDLDIFSQVGYAVAHDVYVPFTVEEDELEAFGAKTDFTGVLDVEFVKGKADNPKINAIVVYKGKEEDIPKLPPLSVPEQEVGDVDDQEEKTEERKFHKTSGPRSRNPYESDESWFWPLTGVAAIFFPVLFCLCRH